MVRVLYIYTCMSLLYICHASTCHVPVCHVVPVPGMSSTYCNLNEHVFFQKIDLPANYCAR